MEELGSAEDLGREVLRDAAARVERLKRQCDAEVAAVEASAADEIAALAESLGRQYRDKASDRDRALESRLPLERKRARDAWRLSSMDAAVAAFWRRRGETWLMGLFASALEGAMGELADAGAGSAMKGRTAPDGKIVRVRVDLPATDDSAAGGQARATDAELSKAFESVEGITLALGRDAAVAEPALVAMSADGRRRFTITRGGLSARALEERRAELAEALFGPGTGAS